MFEKVKIAKEKQENAQIEEDKKLGYYENLIGEYINNTNRESISSAYKYIGQTLNFTYKNDGTEEGYNYYVECDISTYIDDYKTKTTEDFVVEMTNFFVDRMDHVTNTNFKYEYRYDQENGILQVYAKGNWFYYLRPTEFKLYIK